MIHAALWVERELAPLRTPAAVESRLVVEETVIRMGYTLGAVDPRADHAMLVRHAMLIELLRGRLRRMEKTR